MLKSCGNLIIVLTWKIKQWHRSQVNQYLISVSFTQCTTQWHCIAIFDWNSVRDMAQHTKAIIMPSVCTHDDIKFLYNFCFPSTKLITATVKYKLKSSWAMKFLWHPPNHRQLVRCSLHLMVSRWKPSAIAGRRHACGDVATFWETWQSFFPSPDSFNP